MNNGNRDPVQTGLTISKIIAFIENEIRQAAAVRTHLDRDSRSRRTWAATERAYEKVLNWINEHQDK